MCLRILLCALLPIATINYSFSQSDTYQPLNYRAADSTLINALLEHYRHDVLALSRADRKTIGEDYKSRTLDLNAKIDEEHFIFDIPTVAYFDDLLQQILNHNPDIPRERLNLLISRYPWPNASCLGQGTLIVNLGLIGKLENEDQLAFVLCHELAHYTEDHVNHAIRERHEKIAELEKSKRWKDIEKQEYGKYDAVLELLEGVIYNDRRHGRLKESEADALGLRYYLRAGFDPQQAVRVMEVLDRIDEEKYTEKVDWRHILHSEPFPFRSKWLRVERRGGLSAMKDEHQEEQFSADSLKTHPNCMVRKSLLEAQIKDIQGETLRTRSGGSESKKNYQRWSDIADFEAFCFYFDFENYGRAFHHVGNLLTRYPDNIYLRAMLSRTLYELYFAKSEHRLITHVEMPGKHAEAYKESLQIIHNLRLSDLENLIYYSLERNKEEVQRDEEYLFSLWLGSTLLEYKEESDRHKATYLQLFPKGAYRAIMEKDQE